MEQKVIDRFWAKVDKNGPVHPRLGTRCWLWTGRVSGGGYGRIQVCKKVVATHRLVWEAVHGPIPEGTGWHGTVVRHKCDVRNCCRVEHMELGTQLDNIRDRDERERHGARTKLHLWPRGDTHGARTKPESRARGARHGTHTKPGSVTRGERSGTAKVTAEQVVEIRRLAALNDISHTELGRRFGISQTQTTRIVRRTRWAHIP